MRTTLIIDRIEDDQAVIEYAQGGTTFNIPLSLLPEEAREGDVIKISVTIQEEETRRLRLRLERFLDDNMDD